MSVFFLQVEFAAKRVRMYAMSFYGIETWFMKLHKKDLNNISIVFEHKNTCE